jgi:hypothetical protein
VANQPISGGKLVLAGLALLWVPRLAEGRALSDMTMAVLLFASTAAGLACFVIGAVRLVKSRKQKADR